MSAILYAVHTATCTYLLDEEGICRWTHASPGTAAPGTDRCVGAQFVACLDLAAEGGLVGELRLGASALFARREGGRFVLLRTLPIDGVEVREPPAVEDPPSFEETPVMMGAPLGAAPSPKPVTMGAPLGAAPISAPKPPVYHPPAPAFSIAAEQTAPLDPYGSAPAPAIDEAAEPAEELDLEDMLSLSVTEVTVVLPLYRPPSPRRRR